jgi:hypothetical protein
MYYYAKISPGNNAVFANTPSQGGAQRTPKNKNEFPDLEARFIALERVLIDTLVARNEYQHENLILTPRNLMPGPKTGAMKCKQSTSNEEIAQIFTAPPGFRTIGRAIHVIFYGDDLKMLIIIHTK